MNQYTYNFNKEEDKQNCDKLDQEKDKEMVPLTSMNQGPPI